MTTHALPAFAWTLVGAMTLVACGDNVVSVPDDLGFDSEDDELDDERAAAALATSTEASLADEAYTLARQRFLGELRTERLRLRETRPDVEISSNPLWGLLIKNIALVSMGKPLVLLPADPTNGIDAHRRDCAASEGDIEECQVLLWPLMVRLYVLAEQRGAFAEASALRTALLEYFVVMLSTRGRPAATAAEVWDNPASSENHMAAMQTSYLLASHVLASTPDYAERTFDGLSLVDIRAQWLRHWKLWFKERIKRGLLVEVGAHTYSKYTIAALLNLADFGPGAWSQLAARNFLDLVFAMAAVESLPNGARGGSQSRKAPKDGLTSTPFSLYYALYMTSWIAEPVAFGAMAIANLTSSYFPAAAVWSLWGRAPGSYAAYELAARVPGVLAPEPPAPPPRWEALDFGRAVFRRTYVTPSFVLGSNLLDFSRNEYAHGGSEGRSIALYVNEGGLGAGDEVPQILFAPSGHRCYDRAVAVQKRNALIYQNNIAFWRGEGRRPCYGSPAARPPATVPSDVEHIVSTRQNGAVVLDFVQSDYQVSPESGLDKTRESLDASMSRSFQVIASDATDGVFLRSPEGSVFVWMKPLAAQPTNGAALELLEAGYNWDRGEWSTTYVARGMRLKKDKFAPVAVVVASARPYGGADDPGAYSRFESDMRHLNEVAYDGAAVTFRQSLRSSLSERDVFIDSRAGAAMLTGSWEVFSASAAYDGHFVRSTAEDARMISTFAVERAGAYRILGRTAALKGNPKFVVKLDEAPPTRWVAPESTQALRWFDLAPAAGVYLTRGTHTLYLRSDGEGIALDAVALLSDESSYPEEIRFVENIDGTQGVSSIDSVAISASPDHLSHTFKSPFVTSVRDSATWSVRHKKRFLRVDYSGDGPPRTEGFSP